MGSEMCIRDSKWSQLQAAYQKMYDRNFFELVPIEDLRKKVGFFYLSHIPVFQPQSLSTPVRICFCANQPTAEDGQSLNDLQLKGQDLLPNLAQLLLRYRMYRYVCCTDVSAMFYRTKLDESRDYLRFYHSFEKPSSDGKVRLKSYRSTGVCFGLKASPYICMYLSLIHI